MIQTKPLPSSYFEINNNIGQIKKYDTSLVSNKNQEEFLNQLHRGSRKIGPEFIEYPNQPHSSKQTQ